MFESLVSLPLYVTQVWSPEQCQAWARTIDERDSSSLRVILQDPLCAKQLGLFRDLWILKPWTWEGLAEPDKAWWDICEYVYPKSHQWLNIALYQDEVTLFEAYDLMDKESIYVMEEIITQDAINCLMSMNIWDTVWLKLNDRHRDWVQLSFEHLSVENRERWFQHLTPHLTSGQAIHWIKESLYKQHFKWASVWFDIYLHSSSMKTVTKCEVTQKSDLLWDMEFWVQSNVRLFGEQLKTFDPEMESYRIRCLEQIWSSTLDCKLWEQTAMCLLKVGSCDVLQRCHDHLVQRRPPWLKGSVWSWFHDYLMDQPHLQKRRDGLNIFEHVCIHLESDRLRLLIDHEDTPNHRIQKRI